MESQLKAFEKYITSLADLGVFPSFHRLSRGWICVLRNGENKQIMPFSTEENCWAETMMDALTIAVEGLNRRFNDPKELHKYIETGIEQSVEPIQAAKAAVAQ